MDAGCAADESATSWTAKSCGPDTPTLVSSRWKRFHRRRWQQSPVTGEQLYFWERPLIGRPQGWRCAPPPSAA